VIDVERDEVVKVLIGTRIREGVVAGIEEHVGITGPEDRILVDFGDTLLKVSPAQIERT
jgi:hypothetical protein